MPTAAIPISKYGAVVSSYGQSYTAFINLYRADGSIAGQLRFYPPESTPPPNTANNPNFPSAGYASLSYPSSALPSVIDILRNEKPIYLSWYDVTPPYGTIGTSAGEPVGEGEGV
jgi:hypothetical protein